MTHLGFSLKQTLGIFLSCVMLFTVITLATSANEGLDPDDFVSEAPATQEATLWDMSAGVGTVMNPSAGELSGEEREMALQMAAEQSEETAADGAEEGYEIVMSDADFTLNVVADPDEEAEVVGYLYEDCGGRVLAKENGWTQIQSGDLIGWTQDEHLAFGDEALSMASDVGTGIVVVTGGALRARTAPEDNAEVRAILVRGEELDYIEDAGEEWIAVDYNNEIVYVRADYVVKDFSIDTGETLAAIEKREEAKRLEEEREAKRLEEEALAEEEAKEREAAQQAAEQARLDAEEAVKAAEEAARQQAIAVVQTQSPQAVQEATNAAQDAQAQQAALEAQAAMEAAQAAAATQAAAAQATVDDVRLLGALIYCEAGNQPYEGKVAVGAVVMNRVKSGSYPNTIDGVIRASGQFTPVRSGKVDRVYASGVPEECMLAAQEALAGVSPVGTATHFRRNNGRDGLVIGAHVFY